MSARFRVATCVVALLSGGACDQGLETVQVRIVPASADVVMGTSLSLDARVDGAFDAAVTWSIASGSGAIDSNGVYSAPLDGLPDSDVRIVATRITGESAESLLRLVFAPVEPISGARSGGTRIEVGGEGFIAGQTTVRVGGIEVPAQVDAAFRLFAVTPPGAALGPVDVAVLVGGSVVASYPSAFRYAATHIALAGTTSLPICTGARDVRIGDLEGDGDEDMVFLCFADSRLSVWRNNGDGSFGEPETYAVPTAPLSFRLGDLDDDGDLDAVVMSPAGLTFHENGAVGFTEVAFVAVPNKATTFEIADLDGDGWNDLATLEGPPPTQPLSLVVRFRPGGLLTSPQILSLPTSSITAGDLDDDGDIDLVSSTFGAVTLHVNDGAGTFALTDLPPGGDGYVVRLAQTDGDAVVDIVQIGGEPAIRHGLGGGAFGTPEPVSGLPYLSENADIVDLDRDQLDDFVYIDPVFSTLGVVIYGGDPSAKAFPSMFGAFTVRSINLDGAFALDLVVMEEQHVALIHAVAPRTHGSAGVPFHQDNYHYKIPFDLLAPSPGERILAFRQFDDFLYNDSSLLYVAANGSSSQVTLTGFDARAVLLADLDADGADELLAGGGDPIGTSGSLWSFPLTAGVFGNPTDVPMPGKVQDFAVGDLDGDGALDILMGHSDSVMGALVPMWGTGPGGTFEAGDEVSALPSRIVLQDLDGDGRLEALVGDEQAGTLVLAWTAAREVLEIATLPSGANTSTLLLGDWNRDGLPDIATTSVSGSLSQLSIFEGLGGLGFRTGESYRFTQPYTTFQFRGSLLAADVDGDEIVDLVRPAPGESAVIVFRGNGDGTFDEAESVIVGGSPTMAQAVDLDGTGGMDLLVGDLRDSFDDLATAPGVRVLPNTSK